MACFEPADRPVKFTGVFAKAECQLPPSRCFTLSLLEKLVWISFHDLIGACRSCHTWSHAETFELQEPIARPESQRDLSTAPFAARTHWANPEATSVMLQAQAWSCLKICPSIGCLSLLDTSSAAFRTRPRVPTNARLARHVGQNANQNLQMHSPDFVEETEAHRRQRLTACEALRFASSHTHQQIHFAKKTQKGAKLQMPKATSVE